jgi:hypothetical protein
MIPNGEYSCIVHEDLICAIRGYTEATFQILDFGEIYFSLQRGDLERLR